MQVPWKKNSVNLLFVLFLFTHKDNAPVHKSVIAMAAINNNGFDLIEHLPYLPYLDLSDFHLFPELKPFPVRIFGQMMALYMQWRTFWMVKKMASSIVVSRLLNIADKSV